MSLWWYMFLQALTALTRFLERAEQNCQACVAIHVKKRVLQENPARIASVPGKLI